LKKLIEIITADGTFSLVSDQFKESFHSNKGALEETRSKFINPSNLERFKDSSVNVLDICFGMGYNSALLFEKLLNQSSLLNWYGLEIDKRPLNYSLNNENFKNLWDPKVLEILDSLNLYGEFLNKKFICKLLWGDARDQINKIPNDINFDLIFLDSFSPQKCPELWTFEFLQKLSKKLKLGGYLITYSSAAAIRKVFLNLGLNIYSIQINSIASNTWSDGTMATYSKNKKEFKSNSTFKFLTIMENEHLQTKASIPYRDPNAKSSSKEIIERRLKEQSSSKLLETNKWRRKWQLTKFTIRS